MAGVIDDYPAIFNSDKRKARKEHICYECRGAINKGESYFVDSMIFDGEWSKYKICSKCDRRRILISKTLASDEASFYGELMSDWEEYVSIRRRNHETA